VLPLAGSNTLIATFRVYPLCTDLLPGCAVITPSASTGSNKTTKLKKKYDILIPNFLLNTCTFLQVLVAVLLHIVSADLELGGNPVLFRQHRDTEVQAANGTLDSLTPSCKSDKFACENENTYTKCGGKPRSCNPGYYCNPKCANPCTPDIPSC